MTFEQYYSRLRPIYEGKVPLPRGIKEPSPEEISWVGVISLVLPPKEDKWADLEKFLKDLIGTERTSNPFKKL